MIPETYLGFHLRFLLPPITLTIIAAYRRRSATWSTASLSGLAAVVVLAVVYTIPWDNLLIERGVWGYGEGVTTVHLWAAPLGEYLFFVLQPVLVAFWVYNLDIPTDAGLSVPFHSRVLGLMVGLAIGALGIGFLLAGASTLYLGAILAWAGPILAVQWAFGWPQLVRARRAVIVGISIPTIYLWLLDRSAIAAGLWRISGAHTVGIAPFGLPIEEAIFFLLTNVFIVQGLVLYLWLVDRWPTVVTDVRAAVPPTVTPVLPGPSPDPPVSTETISEEAGDDRDRPVR